MSGHRLPYLLQRCARHGLEVWHMDGATARERTREDRKHLPEWSPNRDSPWRAGWYWWSCFPGCLPDGDPMGPYSSATRAAEAALDGLDEDTDPTIATDTLAELRR